MKQIPLQNSNRFALVDDEDFPYLNRFRWSISNIGADEYVAMSLTATDHNSPRKFYIQKFVIDCPQNMEITFIDKNGLNITKQNLRILTKQKRTQTSHGQVISTSKYKGVSWRNVGKKWAAQIYSNGIHHWLGVYKDEKQAAKVYNEKALELFGEHAYQNKLN